MKDTWRFDVGFMEVLKVPVSIYTCCCGFDGGSMED